MKKVTAILIGAGARGSIYARYALEKSDEFKIVGIAEPDEERRLLFAREHHLPPEALYDDWKKLLSLPRMADAALICTMDHLHTRPALKALELGYHILLEKPMAPTEEECRLITQAAEESGQILSICHVLRYTPFYSTIKEQLEKGSIGKMIAMTQTEHVGYWHQAHSFVRGNWADTRHATPMILQKCCHDTDIICWLMGQTCTRVSSYGSLTHFIPENAPSGAPMYCLDGCPSQDKCLYYAPKFYLEHPKAATDGFTRMLTAHPTSEAVLNALKSGPYGRCVYHCSNDAVDHQTVSMEFADGSIAALMMCAFSRDCNRTLHIMGTKGELFGNMEENLITIHQFGSDETQSVPVRVPQTAYSYNHNGGDYRLIQDFVRSVRELNPALNRSAARQSLEGHLICFAAEKARLGLL